MLQFVLDTNICIYIAKQKPPEVLARFSRLESGTVGMSFVTYGELLYGALRSCKPEMARGKLQELTRLIPVVPAPPELPDHYSEVRAHLAAQGQPIGNNDLWIAAHVRAEGKTLVSNNLKEFECVPGLTLENWVEPSRDVR